MHCHINTKNGQEAPLVADDVFEIVMQVCQTGPYSKSIIKAYHRKCQRSIARHDAAGWRTISKLSVLAEC